MVLFYFNNRVQFLNKLRQLQPDLFCKLGKDICEKVNSIAIYDGEESGYALTLVYDFSLDLKDRLEEGIISIGLDENIKSINLTSGEYDDHIRLHIILDKLSTFKDIKESLAPNEIKRATVRMTSELSECAVITMTYSDITKFSSICTNFKINLSNDTNVSKEEFYMYIAMLSSNFLNKEIPCTIKTDFTVDGSKLQKLYKKLNHSTPTEMEIQELFVDTVRF